MSQQIPGPGALPNWAATALVFGSSAAVLVVELAALRLLAPYFGLTLETNTLVIGTCLPLGGVACAVGHAQPLAAESASATPLWVSHIEGGRAVTELGLRSRCGA